MYILFFVILNCHFSDEVLNNSSEQSEESRGHPRIHSLCVLEILRRFAPLDDNWEE